MAQIELKPIDKNDKASAIEAIQAYKRQNPVKFELKKNELLARYGLTPDTPIETPKDDMDIELEKQLTKVKK